MHMCKRCNGVYITCGWLKDVSWPQVSNVSTENKHLSWNIILVNKHAFLENHKIMRLIFLKINNHFFLERLFYGMRLKCLPCLMNSLLASGKIKEQFPKKSVGWLSTNSQLTNNQQVATKWWTVGRESVNCCSTVYRQSAGRFFGELFFNFTNLPPFPFHTGRLPLDNLT